MTKVVLAARFKKDMKAKARSTRVSRAIKSSIEGLIVIPTAGSTNLPDPIVEAFGENVRKLPSPPFLIVYSYDASADVVEVYALLHERQGYR